MTFRFVVVVGLLFCLGQLTAIPVGSQNDPNDIEMSILSTQNDKSSQEITPLQLVNGDLAIPNANEGSEKGPQVNGGFAESILPHGKPATRKLSNADCAGGHLVDGRCLRPFPKPERVAKVSDNMESPEQKGSSAFEPDLHTFVVQHFGADVMKETPKTTHLDGLPGYQLMSKEMNKVGNKEGNSVDNSMFSVGTGMMTDGDIEVPIELGTMNLHQSSTLNQQLSSVSSASSTTSSTTTSSTSSDLSNPNSSSTNSVNSGNSITSNNNEQDPTAVIVPVSNPENVNEELEEKLPQSPLVDEEPELPPTPTPLPTPDPVLLLAQEAERQKKAETVAACLSLFESEHIDCSANPQDREKMSGETVTCVENLQVTQETKVVKNVTNDSVIFRSAYEANHIKENFQSLLLFCVRKGTKNYASTFQNIAVDDQALAKQRAHFAQQLVKYSSAMNCVDSDDFPNCIPNEAKEIILLPPAGGEWNCF